MNSASNTFFHFLSRFISLAFTGLFGFYSLVGGFNTPPEPAQEFTPVVRFAVCSDVHLNGDPEQAAAIRMGQLFDDSYAYAEASGAYRALDAVIVVGDFATNGKAEEYALYNEIVDAHIKGNTQTLEVLGNHEFIAYRDVDASVGYDVYKEYIHPEVDRHDVINGYHFIGVSYNPDGKKFTQKLSWLKEQLDAAKADDPNKPIFVYQHPHPFGTVYGSVNWGQPELRTVLDLYPQIVDFSGHSHYCPADPRSIWQGAFTAVGTGSLSAFMSNLNYVDGDEDAPGESGGFWMVEADAEGNVRLQLYDIVNHTFFPEIDYFLTNLSKVNDRPYNWDNRMRFDTAPVFPDDAGISVSRNNLGNAVLSFPDAAGFYEAENYKISVQKEGKLRPVWDDTVVSDYVRAGRTGVNVDLGPLEDGAYTVKITANSPYEKQGQTLTGTVTLEAQTIIPGDVNCDGEVTAEDARLALRAAVGLEDFPENSPAFRAADLDGSGDITAEDARAILRLAVGLETD